MVHEQFSRVAALCSLVVVLGLSCKPKSGQPTPSASASVAAAEATPVKPALPPEPPPAFANRAAEVPALEAKLAADKAYQAVWTGPRPDLNSFLSYVGELVATGGAPKPLADAVQARKLQDAGIKLFLVFSRIGGFPDDFTKKLAAHLDATKAEPHVGTWSAFVKGGGVHDFTSLAAWSRPEDASLMREHVAAKADGAGPFPGTAWTGKEAPARPWLVDEGAALDRLALLTKLTEEEKARRAFLTAEAKKPKQPKLGEDFRLGDFTYAVKSVEVVDTAGTGIAQKKASEGAQFVLVHFTIKNEGNATATVSTDDFKIVDAKGREYRPSSEANTALSMSGGKDFLLSELQPGIKKNTVTAFELPEDAAKGIFTLVVPEKGFLGTGSVRITLK